MDDVNLIVSQNLISIEIKILLSLIKYKKKKNDLF